jgi:TRAP-type C4-dicarboxylate transport system permease small subunit
MLNKIVSKMYPILEALAGLLFLTLFALNILRIGMRYIAGTAWIWLPDFSRLLFVWVVFIGASVLVGRNGHLLMDYFVSKMRPATSRKLGIAIQLSQIAFFAVMLAGGVRIASVRMRIPFDTWDFPTGWAYIAVPVCAVLMILFSVNNILQAFSRGEGTK